MLLWDDPSEPLLQPHGGDQTQQREGDERDQPADNRRRQPADHGCRGEQQGNLLSGKRIRDSARAPAAVANAARQVREAQLALAVRALHRGRA
jgi:hypothetical protein